MSKKAALALLLAFVVVGAIAIAPRAPRLGSEVSGDAWLTAEARAALQGQQGMRALAVARVERGRVSTAGLGPGVGALTRFELGSVTKPLTGMLLAELATHRSGLPRLPVSAMALARLGPAQLGAGDPYGAVTTAELIDVAGKQGTDGRGQDAYSNLGMSLLGERVLSPLEMNDTVVIGPGRAPPAPHVSPTKAGGRSASPWRSLGYAPAGTGVWSTSEDLGRLLRRVLARTAPGQAATRPRVETDDPGEPIGLG